MCLCVRALECERVCMDSKYTAYINQYSISICKFQTARMFNFRAGNQQSVLADTDPYRLFCLFLLAGRGFIDLWLETFILLLSSGHMI